MKRTSYQVPTHVPAPQCYHGECFSNKGL